MLSSVATLLLAASTFTTAQTSYGSNGNGNGSSSSPFPPFSGDPFMKHDLEADGIKASFVPYGARLTNMYVKDRDGEWQDVAIGYDDASDYTNSSSARPGYLGAVVGRYANRIANGTFELDGEEYEVAKNENDGVNTLHGGETGYDKRNWTVAAHTDNSITFTLYDAAYEGFPGDVLNVATYTVTDDAAWVSRLVSIPLDHATPIMLSNHAYWNLGAFTDQEQLAVLNDTLHLPYAARYIEVDGILIPNGTIGITNGTALDFTSPKQIGQDILDNSCGTGCTGYDNAFILDRPRYSGSDDPQLEVLQMYSNTTGIQMSMETNMQGLQIFSCNGLNGTVAVKEDQQHGDGETGIPAFGCFVIEAQDWIDGINNPQWGRDQWQIYSPTSMPAVNYQKYTFSTREEN